MTTLDQVLMLGGGHGVVGTVCVTTLEQVLMLGGGHGVVGTVSA